MLAQLTLTSKQINFSITHNYITHTQRDERARAHDSMPGYFFFAHGKYFAGHTIIRFDSIDFHDHYCIDVAPLYQPTDGSAVGLSRAHMRVAVICLFHSFVVQLNILRAVSPHSLSHKRFVVVVLLLFKTSTFAFVVDKNHERDNYFCKLIKSKYYTFVMSRRTKDVQHFSESAALE